MTAYLAKPKQRIQVEANLWIEPSEQVTVTPSATKENAFDVWYSAGAIYLGLPADWFDVVSVIFES